MTNEARSHAGDAVATFIEAACVPLDASHASGTLAAADAILAAHPSVATASIHTAAVLGDEATVRDFLEHDSASASRKGGPHGWDALTHLCFSNYLRLAPDTSDAFVRTAAALLDAGANVNTGWHETHHTPHPVWESALYGAAGVAHHPELTRLLLERGADPNDDETPYHSPETNDNRALAVLVESGKLSADSLATMLLRKADWHDFEGIKYLLVHGADPNRMTRWRRTALHQALYRDNDLPHIEIMVELGADPRLARGEDGLSGIAIAARRGRGDALELFRRRGVSLELHGVERLVAACALDDVAQIRALVDRQPTLVDELLARGGTLLAEFGGVGNTNGVRQLLDLGVNVRVRYQGDAYFGIASDSMALHVAAWRARHDTVRLLIDRGAPVDALDGAGRTPLQLAVRACVDSYWTQRRSPDSVAALLDAGASTVGVPYPSGFDPVDRLLRRHLASSV